MCPPAPAPARCAVQGTWTPLHSDVLRSHSWSANVAGRKRWRLLPPWHSHLLLDRQGRSTAWDFFAADPEGWAAGGQAAAVSAGARRGMGGRHAHPPRSRRASRKGHAPEERHASCNGLSDMVCRSKGTTCTRSACHRMAACRPHLSLRPAPACLQGGTQGCPRRGGTC